MTNTVGQKLALVPAGDFTMGALPRPAFYTKLFAARTQAEKLGLLMREPPQQMKAIPRAFRMSAHEVTVGQFRRFVKAAGYRTDAQRAGTGGTGLTEDKQWKQAPGFTWENYGFPVTDDHPVANVSYNDAVAFCKWLSAQEGRAYRLPSEVEWEYACRGGTETTYFTGNSPESLKGYANVADRSLKAVTPGLAHALPHDDGHPYLAPVGKFKPNAFGLFDMHGNALEWCADRFSAYDPLERVASAPEKPRSELYTVRGGNWFNDPKLAGSACRSGAPPTQAMALIGFRVVLETPGDLVPKGGKPAGGRGPEGRPGVKEGEKPA